MEMLLLREGEAERDERRSALVLRMNTSYEKGEIWDGTEGWREDTKQTESKRSSAVFLHYLFYCFWRQLPRCTHGVSRSMKSKHKKKKSVPHM